MKAEQIKEAMAMISNGIPASDVARFYEVSRQYISRLRKQHKVGRNGRLIPFCIFADIPRPKSKKPKLRDKKKRLANSLVTAALKNGVLVPEPCEVCGVYGKSEGRNIVHAHHDDYSHPLNVRWLCPQHHVDWHRANKAKV